MLSDLQASTTQAEKEKVDCHWKSKMADNICWTQPAERKNSDCQIFT